MKLVKNKSQLLSASRQQVPKMYSLIAAAPNNLFKSLKNSQIILDRNSLINLLQFRRFNETIPSIRRKKIGQQMFILTSNNKLAILVLSKETSRLIQLKSKTIRWVKGGK